VLKLRCRKEVLRSLRSHKQAFPVPVLVTRFLVKLFEAVLQRLQKGRKQIELIWKNSVWREVQNLQLKSKAKWILGLLQGTNDTSVFPKGIFLFPLTYRNSLLILNTFVCIQKLYFFPLFNKSFFYLTFFSHSSVRVRLVYRKISILITLGTCNRL